MKTRLFPHYRSVSGTPYEAETNRKKVPPGSGPDIRFFTPQS